MRSLTSSFVKKTILFAICVLFFFTFIFGNNNDEPCFEHIDFDFEFVNSNIVSIVQDNYGFIWFGTLNGLYLFDGFEFTAFRHEYNDPSSLSDNTIMKIHKTHDGEIWIGTMNGGLNKLERETGNFITYQHNPSDPNSLSNNTIRDIAEADSGKLWIATLGGGLDLFDPVTGEFKHFTHDPENSSSIADDYLMSLFRDSIGRLWIGTFTNGLDMYDIKTKSFSHYKNNSDDNKSISGNIIRSITQDASGNIWVGTKNNGLNRLEESNNTFKRYNSKFGNEQGEIGNHIFTMYTDSKNNFWVGTQGNGLALYNSKTDSFISYCNDPLDEYSIKGDNILSIFEDNTGLLWIGIQGAGVDKLVHFERPFKVYSNNGIDNLLRGNIVRAFSEDNDGLLWIGTEDGGLNVFDPVSGNFENHLIGDLAYEKLNIRTISIDNTGKVWLGTHGNGLKCFDSRNGNVKTYNHIEDNDSSICCNYILSTLIDNSNNFWMGTQNGGLCYYNKANDSFISLNENDGLNSNTVFSLFQDEHGCLWVGTSEGLQIIDTNTSKLELSNEINDTLLPKASIYTISGTSDGDVWLVTIDGLMKYDSKLNEFINYKNELCLDAVSLAGAQIDNEGNVWISTDSGLYKIDPDSKKHEHFGQKAGIKNSFFMMNSFIKLKNGYMAFGKIDGFIYFDPLMIVRKKRTSQIYFTDFEIFNVNDDSIRTLNKAIINNVSHIELSSSDVLFNVAFTALEFRNPGEIEYEYMLEPIQTEWLSSGKRNYINFINLPSGNYILKVRISGSDSTLKESYASLSIVVQIPPWKSWWAIMIYTATILILLSLFFRLKARYTKARVKRKIEKFYASRDAMTGILNRRAGLQILEKQIEISKNTKTPLSICFVDMDNLKRINDNCGHKIGDEAILSLLNLLKEVVRGEDNICRIGGDEFLIIFNNCHIEEAESIWFRILEKIEAFNQEMGRFNLSVSHGLVELDLAAPESLDKFIENADNEMYKEKRRKKSMENKLSCE